MTITTESKKNSVIVIDCGHGGEDPGAVGVNNVYESDVNLSFGLKFNDILKLNGYDTVLTRNDKKYYADPIGYLLQDAKYAAIVKIKDEKGNILKHSKRAEPYNPIER